MLQLSFKEYFESSSFPYSLELKGQPGELRDDLESIYSTIVVKNIVNRKKITDIVILKNVLRFVFESDGRKIDAKTVDKHLEAIEKTINHFIFWKRKSTISI